MSTVDTTEEMKVSPDAGYGKEVNAMDHAHVFHSWAAQAEIHPVAIAGAKGSVMWDYQGHEYLDFASQLINVNLGHQHPKLIAAIVEQANKLAYIQPAFANDTRSKLASLISEAAPGDMPKVFFTNGGADANENAVRLARLATGRRKVLALYRSYHGATATAISLSGDPRRWESEPSDGGVVHFFGPYLYRSVFNATTEAEECARALAHFEQVVALEGPDKIAAVIIESVVGTNGVLVPPKGYLAGVKKICEQHGILYIADEVMAGFGRTGTLFAIENFGVKPDLISFAKGVNSGTVPLGGVIISREVAAHFDHNAYPGGLTYSGHPLACAPGVATFGVFKEEKILEHVNDLATRIFEPKLKEIAAKHPSVGEYRGIGFFWALELVKNQGTREALIPFNAKGEATAPMGKIAAAMKAKGLWPFTPGNRIHLAPPLTISEAQLVKGLEIVDECLAVADDYVEA